MILLRNDLKKIIENNQEKLKKIRYKQSRNKGEMTVTLCMACTFFNNGGGEIASLYMKKYMCMFKAFVENE